MDQISETERTAINLADRYLSERRSRDGSTSETEYQEYMQQQAERAKRTKKQRLIWIGAIIMIAGSIFLLLR